MPAVIERTKHPTPPRVLVLNESDEGGGAARAALRISTGLRRRGVPLEVVVQRMIGDRYWIFRDESAKGKLLARSIGLLDPLPNMLYPGRSGLSWSNNWFPHDAGRALKLGRYNLLHMHWVAGGVLSIGALAKIDVPVVWTLHDMWSFTGGCHYTEDCTRYKDACGRCPQLGSRADRDLSAWNLCAKRRAFRGKRMHIVSPSNWLAAAARNSALFRDFDVRVIPNGIDVDVYRPIDRRTARDVLGLPTDAPIVLFGTANALRDGRKGFPLLCTALAELAKNSGLSSDAQLVVFGSNQPRDRPDTGLPVRFMGNMADDVSLVCLYSAADVMVVPSRQENLANTIMEAMACGTPVVAFDTGGNGDLIDHRQSGYLAKPFDPADLGAGIAWVLGDAARAARLSEAAREKCERLFDLDVVCRQYEDLYRSALFQGAQGSRD